MSTLPGFNAEASLYNSAGRYQQRQLNSDVAGGATRIQAAQEDECSGGGGTCHCSGHCGASSGGCTCLPTVDEAFRFLLR